MGSQPWVSDMPAWQCIPLFREAPFVPGISVSGWIYGETWSGAPESELIRNDSFRPAMTRLVQELGRPTN